MAQCRTQDIARTAGATWIGRIKFERRSRARWDVQAGPFGDIGCTCSLAGQSRLRPAAYDPSRAGRTRDAEATYCAPQIVSAIHSRTKPPRSAEIQIPRGACAAEARRIFRFSAFRTTRLAL